MSYKIYWTDTIVPEADFLANKNTLMEKAYAEFDDALAFARNVNDSGGIAWAIEGRSGRLSRREIEDTIRVRARQLVGRPKAS